MCYADDDGEHTELVLRFGALLRHNGVDAQLDHYARNKRRDRFAWYLGEIDQSEYIIVIASPAYRAAGDGNPETGHRDVATVAGQLRDRLHDDPDTWTNKILPVVLPGRSTQEIPQFLQPSSADSYVVDELTTAGIGRVLRILTQQAHDPPPALGHSRVYDWRRPTPSPHLDERANELAVLVEKQWRTERRRRGMQDPEPLPVRWTAADETLADHPESTGQLRVKTDGQLNGIVGLFDELPHRRLVVLGPAGAGKSVLAMQFTIERLKHRWSGDPVPVLFPLTSWDPAQSLRRWLSARLAADYPGLGPLAEELVNTGRILPVLDGLDEISESLRGIAVKCLNDQLDEDDPS